MPDNSRLCDRRPCDQGRYQTAADHPWPGKIARSCAAVLAICLLLFARMPTARAADDARLIAFDIAAQPLGDALLAYSEQADVQIIVPAAIVKDLISPALSGRMDKVTALERLLGGSDLGYEFSGVGTVTVLRKAGAGSGAGTAPAAPEQAPLKGEQGGNAAPLPAAGGDDFALEEIVVTAQKREESIQSIALAVSALGGRELDAMNIYNPVDLGDRVPGLNMFKSEGYRRIVTIRGVGNESPQNAGSRPGVSFHIDGAFIVDDVFLQADLLDVDRVEVVRGPQGTVFGQNSTGGTINVVSKRPQFDEISGGGDVTFGSYSTINA
ncbi:MAG: hypothetical protein D6782_09715, partial [Alphaproteobacteria bacterium]